MINNQNILYLQKELNKIKTLYENKKFKTVIEKATHILKKNLRQPIIHNYIGLSYTQLNKLEEARSVFLQAIEYIPADASIYGNLGMVHKKLYFLDDARNCFKKAINIDQKHLPSHINLGHLETALNRSDLAEKHYLDAYKINETSEEVLTYLILNLSANGKFSKAKEKITELKKNYPNSSKAHHLFSKIHNYEIDDEHQKEMLNKINNKNINLEDLSNLYFAIAKSFFDQKNIKQSANFTKKANNTKFRIFTNYKFNEEEAKFHQIKKYFGNLNFNTKDNQNGKNLIFILGLPRSGTTLLHQIISSHSKVFGAEESPILNGVISNYFKDDSNYNQFFLNKEFNEDIASKLSDEILFKYKMYDDHKIILDKMPFNFKWIGFIKLLFPKAKIIHSNRNLADTAFSIYRNIFDSPIAWTYNQDYLIQYVSCYNELMKFWKERLGSFIYDCQYENLVNNQVFETEKILEFCDLAFEENCINYTKNKSPVKTISVTQARKKIYKSSVKLSDKYLDYFPFLNEIE